MRPSSRRARTAASPLSPRPWGGRRPGGERGGEGGGGGGGGWGGGVVARGADRVIAFVAETGGGATAGVLTPVPGYFNAVRAVCDRHGVLLILDEVMCGMGRTGTLYASEQEDVV